MTTINISPTPAGVDHMTSMFLQERVEAERIISDSLQMLAGIVTPQRRTLLPPSSPAKEVALIVRSLALLIEDSYARIEKFDEALAELNGVDPVRMRLNETRAQLASVEALGEYFDNNIDTVQNRRASQALELLATQLARTIPALEEQDALNRVSRCISESTAKAAPAPAKETLGRPWSEERARRDHRKFDPKEAIPGGKVVQVSWKDEGRSGPITVTLDQPGPDGLWWGCGWGTLAQAKKLAKTLKVPFALD